MSTWTTPITWANGSVSAATANTEWRDHLNWLKGALDLLTGSTAADTGNTMFLQIIRGSAGLNAVNAKVTGDANARWDVNADGSMHWGPGTTTTDTTLSRSGANEMTMSGTFKATRVTLDGLTDSVNINGGWISLERRADPALANITVAEGALYTRDNGSGKTQLCVRFGTGNPIVLATQA